MDPTLLADTLLARAAEAVAARVRLPESTYRLQFHAGFTFRDALAIVPYLRDLGITHCYASPYLKARPGSTHGYDIIDHGCLNPEIGTPEDYEALVAALREHGLGQILDTVPNHMAVGTNDNAWWNDVLEDGPSSRYGAYFDIAWRTSSRPELQDKVLLPVLGEPYGDVLEAGQLRLAFADGAFSVHYYDRRFPVAPHSYGKVLGHRPDELEQALGAEDPDLIEYQSILTAVRNLPDRTETDPDKVAERRREKEVIKRRLAELADRSEPVRALHRAERGALQRPAGRPAELRPPGRPAGAPVLPPGLLAGGPRRDQLPTVLRHQRPGRPQHGARGRLRSRPRPGPPAAGGGEAGRPAHRPPRRPLRSGHVLPAAPGALRPGLRPQGLRGRPRRCPRPGLEGRGGPAPRSHRLAGDGAGSRPARPAALRRRREDPRGG